MRCRAVRRLISDEIDGRLAPRKRRSFEKHLAACLSCREYGERLRNLQAKSARTGAPAVPAGYWEGSIARLREKLETVRTETWGRARIRRPVPRRFPDGHGLEPRPSSSPGSGSILCLAHRTKCSIAFP